MPKPTRPTFLRRKLGAKLRLMREQAGLTLADAAPQLDRKRSALHRLETGETMADVHIVRSMLTLYGCKNPALVDETRKARIQPWYQRYGINNADYVDAETAASEAYQFVPITVPDLLQTEDHTRILVKTGRGATPQPDGVIETHRIRQQRLASETEPLALVAVVHEAALRRRVGGPEVHRDQLRHLIRMSARPTVTLQVIPLEDDRFPLPTSAFTVLRLPDPAEPRMLYVDHPTGPAPVEDADETEEAQHVFENLRTRALTTAESLTLIKRLTTHL